MLQASAASNSLSFFSSGKYLVLTITDTNTDTCTHSDEDHWAHHQQDQQDSVEGETLQEPEQSSSSDQFSLDPPGPGQQQGKTCVLLLPNTSMGDD